MVPSLDTYVHDKFQEIVKSIMSSETVVKQALVNIDKEARENFLKAYGGKKPKHEIKFSYTFPQQKESFDARYVFELGQSVMTNSSLGGVEGTFTNREKAVRHEKSIVQVYDPNPNLLCIPMSDLIAYIINVENLSFSNEDGVHVDENNILFNRAGNESLINLEVSVHYQSKFENDAKGVKKGFTERASVTVIPISYNMDTARCLDAIAKVAIIMMKETPEEKDTFLLQEHRFEEMKTLLDPEADMIGFGRPFTLQYTVSNSIDYDFVDELKEIIIRGRES